MNMKQIIVGVILLITAGLFANNLEVSDVKFDSNGRTFYVNSNDLSNGMNLIPELPQQEAHSSRDGFFIYWDDNYPSVPVSNLDNYWSSYPKIKIDSENTKHVVYENKDSAGDHIGYKYKTEGGEWSDRIYVDQFIEVRNNHSPGIGISNNGDLHVAFTYWAYDNAKNQISYSHYDKLNDEWSQEIISNAGGSVSMSPNIEIFSSTDNNPVVVWDGDYREDNVNPKVYLSFFNGTEWSEDENISSLDAVQAWAVSTAQLDEDNVMITYKESDGTDYWVSFRIWNHTTQSLSESTVIENSSHPVSLFDIVQYNDTVYMGYGNEGSFYFMKYDPALGIWENLDSSFAAYPTQGNNYIKPAMSSTEDILSIAYYQWHIVGSDWFYEINYAEVIDDIITQENVQLTVEEAHPNSSLQLENDNDGNVHLVFADNRYDQPGNWDTHEVMYRKGTVEEVGMEDNYELSIMNYELKQNYPNPFNPVTKICYELSVIGDQLAEIVVYNATGQMVWSSPLTDHGSRVTGSILFDGSALNSGIYYYSLVVGGKNLSTKSMVLIK